ncbi:MAG: restriction endonuclease subunit S [Armatimonadota bacterium]
MTDSPLPQGWKHSTIGDLAKVNPEALTSRTPPDYTFDYVDIASVTGPDRVLPPQRLRYDAAPSRAKRLVRQGDIIVATVRPYLRAFAMFRDRIQDIVCSTGFAVVRSNVPELAEYLYQWFLSPWFLQHAEARMVGSNYPAITGNDVEDFTVLLPTAAEVMKIAAILRSVDEAIERTEAVIAALREVKRAMMQELLTKGISEDGQIRDPKANPEQFHVTKLGLLPKAWEIVRVAQAGDVRLGRQRAPKYQTGDHTTPYLRVANVFDGYIDYSDVLAMDFTPAERGTYGLVPGDILLNEGQSLELVGRSAIYDGEPEQYCFQNTLVRFRCNETTTPVYCRTIFKRWLDTGRFQVVASQTTSVAHLGAERFVRMLFPRPPLAEQERISLALTASDEAAAKSDAELAVLNSLKRGLMQQLLTGKVRVL